MTSHAFVDESKERGLLVRAAILSPTDLAGARATMRGLVHPGSERVHMSKERPARRSLIARTVAGLPVRAHIYDAKSFPPREELKAREQCLLRLVEDLADSGCQRLVIERDDSLVVHDRRTLYAAVHSRDLVDDLRYEHMRAKEESLLWVADAVAWCWNKGGSWRDQVNPVVAAVHHI
jgi:hypothetical protein